MKNILLIPVGGTICTRLDEKGNLSVGEKAGLVLTDNFKKSDSAYAGEVHFVLSENLYILSENMTIDKWNIMIDAFRKYAADKEYDGIIVAHGTDTLAYSAALFSQLLADTEIPVFFVSANRPLSSEQSNGNDNFRCAVECICRDIIPGVYVVYKNPSDRKMYLHQASRLTQCPNYSEDFNSVGQVEITDISQEDFKKFSAKLKQMYPPEKRNPMVRLSEKTILKPCVLMLEPYVGMDYSAFRYENYSAVLHGTFHSGTACAQTDNGVNSILYMIDKCAEYGVDTYLSPAVAKKGTYETVSIIGEHKAPNGKSIAFVSGFTKEMIYAKLLIAYSLFDDRKKTEEFLKTECNFEVID